MQTATPRVADDHKRSIMQRTPVSSSNLRSVGYDLTSNTLEIEFRNGRIYQYFHVPETMYLALMQASSHGRYFDAYIKKGPYPYKRIR
jgi:CHASE1-domain containing sensor protein